ncbi:MAG: hypothetical protein ACFFD8_05000, partial [Candidatus Thorarchaeota archaeon]
FDRLNIKYGNRPIIEHAVLTHFNDQARDILEALRPASAYYESVRDQIIAYSLEYGLEADIIF